MTVQHGRQDTRRDQSPAPSPYPGFRAWWRAADRPALSALIAAIVSVVTFGWFFLGSIIALVTLVTTIRLLRRPVGWRGMVWTAFGICVVNILATALAVLGLFAWTTTTDDGGGPVTATSVPASPVRG